MAENVTTPADSLTMIVEHCARCLGRHDAVEFWRFTYPMIVATEQGQLQLTHWGMCPDAGQPILVMVAPE